jgi:hypothetical protein
MSDKKPKQKKKEKENNIFHKQSDAGKGDVPRTSISQEEWGKKWEKIFRPKERKAESWREDLVFTKEDGENER